MDTFESSPTDAELMLQLCAGHQSQLETLMRRYYQPLFRVAWSKLNHRQAAEDIVQETFIAVYGSRESYRPGLSFRTWVWTILLNLCRRQLKKSARNKQVNHQDPELLVQLAPASLIHAETGLSQLLLLEKREQVIHALNQLPEMQADAIRLRFYGELAYEEIARTMECSLSGAKRRVQTGLLKLAESLRTNEEDLI
ncbi:MAG: RNA polymerase sigma factor [Planctomycetaceae bacterium]